MGGWPSDKDARDCIDVLCDEFDWSYVETQGGQAHPVGYLLCKERSRDGCRINVYGTGRNTARKIWGASKRCSHECAPSRKHW